MRLDIELPLDIFDKLQQQKETNQVFILAAIREKLDRREKKKRTGNPIALELLDIWCDRYPKYHNGEKYVVSPKDYGVCLGLVKENRDELFKRFKRYVQRNGAYYLGHPLTKFRWNEYSDSEWSKHTQNIAAVKDKGKQPEAIKRSTVTCPHCGEYGINLQTHKCEG